MGPRSGACALVEAHEASLRRMRTCGGTMEGGLTRAHAQLWSPERAPLRHAHLPARPERERLLGTRRRSASPPSGLRSRPKRPSL